jgi:hypothetical protein
MLASALILIATERSRAETITFAGREVVVMPPAGYCAMNKSLRPDAALIRILERGNDGRNAVLLAFVDCESLPPWRRSEVSSFARWGQFLAPLQDGEARVTPAVTRADMVRAIAQAVPRLRWQEIAREIEERIASSGSGVQVESMTSLGIVHVDDKAAYHGLLLPLVLPDSSRVIVAGLVAMTLVNQVIVSINLYRPFVDQGTITALLEDQRQNIEALIRANGG